MNYYINSKINNVWLTDVEYIKTGSKGLFILLIISFSFSLEEKITGLIFKLFCVLGGKVLLEITWR